MTRDFHPHVGWPHSPVNILSALYQMQWLYGPSPIQYSTGANPSVQLAASISACAWTCAHGRVQGPYYPPCEQCQTDGSNTKLIEVASRILESAGYAVEPPRELVPDRRPESRAPEKTEWQNA